MNDVAADAERIRRDFDEKYLSDTLDLAEECGRRGEPPFGTSIIRDGTVVARAVNGVVRSLDPTEHAEIAAIRIATKALGTLDLSSCIAYTSCEPCVMCRGALLWSRISLVFFSAGRELAESYGFSDGYPNARVFFNSPQCIAKLALRGEVPFIEWAKSETRVGY